MFTRVIRLCRKSKCKFIVLGKNLLCFPCMPTVVIWLKTAINCIGCTTFNTKLRPHKELWLKFRWFRYRNSLNVSGCIESILLYDKSMFSKRRAPWKMPVTNCRKEFRERLSSLSCDARKNGEFWCVTKDEMVQLIALKRSNWRYVSNTIDGKYFGLEFRQITFFMPTGGRRGFLRL